MIRVSFTDGTNYAERVLNGSLNKSDNKEVPWAQITVVAIPFHCSGTLFIISNTSL
jgi:hypothetical protein